MKATNAYLKTRATADPGKIYAYSWLLASPCYIATHFSMHKLQKLIVTSSLFFATPYSLAANINIDLPINLQQPVFADLVKDLGAVIVYRSIASPEPLGELGVDVSMEVTATSLQTNALDQVTTGNAPNTIVAPKIHIHKGLPLNIDLGAVYSVIPDSNMKYFGTEIRYAFSEVGFDTPAMALRGSYSVLTGVDHFDLSSAGLEFSLSKRYGKFTPYASIGGVWIGGDSDRDSLSRESFTQTKVSLGLKVNFGLVNLAAEWDYTGGNNSYSGKLGFRF